MAVQSRELHPERPFRIAWPTLQKGAVLYLPVTLLVICLAYLLLSHLFGMAQILADDLRYGRPRTFHLTAPVGRPEERDAMTHLIAMNLNRQVVILELPGGDVAKMRALPGPYLFGEGEDLTPVTMRLVDMNGDGSPDLLVGAKNEEVIYLNHESGFALITTEERQQLIP